MRDAWSGTVWRVALAVTAAVVLGVVGQVDAQEYCLGAEPNSRFHLHTVGSTVTGLGTVWSVVGIHHVTGETELRNPVTGTIFVEPPPVTRYRVDLLETGSPGTHNRIWNATLNVVVGFVATNILGPFTVDTMPAGMLLTNRGTGTLMLVDCQTGIAVSV